MSVHPLPEASGASAPSEPQRSLEASAQLLREWFGCRIGAARLIAKLYAAEGQVVRRTTLAAYLGLTPNSLEQQVKTARGVMDPGSIAACYGVGLSLTPVGLEDCRQALADARQRSAA